MASSNKPQELITIDIKTAASQKLKLLIQSVVQF